MIDNGKREVLGVGVNIIDYEAAVDRIVRAAQERRSLTVTALAVHGVMTGALDTTHRYRLNQLDLVVPDGQPVRWALNWLYKAGLTDRVYGPNLMLYTCEAAAKHGLPVFIYGSKQSVLDALQANLKARFPALEIVAAVPSRFRQLSADEKDEVAAMIRDSGAAITFVGLGCPRQETWAYEYREVLPMPVLAIGAAFDFHAGTLPQAPPWMQRNGLEWFFRLVQEPARLWKRYLYLNPYYLTLLFLQATGLRRLKAADGIPPTDEMRYG